MKKAVCMLAALCLLAACREKPQELMLHYNEPAQFFEEALPLGNGRLGAMVYGNVTQEERISLNDITLWTGEPDRGPEHPDLQMVGLTGSGAETLQAIREALEQEDYRKAEELQLGLQGHFTESYQPLGSLYIHYLDSADITDYRRELNLSTATATVSCLKDGQPFRASCFVSAPDSVIVLRLTSGAGIDADVRLDSPLDHENVAFPDRLAIDGYARWHAYPNYYYGEKLQMPLSDPSRGIHFRTLLGCKPEDGSAVVEDGLLKLRGCHDVMLYVVNSTSFNGFDKDPVREGKDYKALVSANFDRVARKNYNALRKDHEADFGQFMGRVSLDLGATPDSVKVLPTDVQLKRYTDLQEANPELEALYYQYGRYLLISSSRTDGVPANLQGLWNESMEPPWSCNYTININLEENYWPAEAAALPEMHEAMLSFVRNLSLNGEPVARRLYGVTRGWHAGHNSDIWATATPVGLGTGVPMWANWTMGGAWCATHIWEHYVFTRDRATLERDYPALRGAAEFCLDFLVEKDGELITSPGTSPENDYITPDGYNGSTLYGATADLALVRECLTDAVKAARELGTDDAFAEEAEAALERLRGYHIGSQGQLQEWYYDWADRDPQHRHQSHLIGV